MAQRPLILVTNDDGITAPGIRALIDVMLLLGDVVVVAPDSAQSGMGHAITINDTLYLEEFRFRESDSHKEYACSGTPADCVKMATQEVLGRKPDLCVSGINHGTNSSINVLYSGTMSAAIEAAVEGVPAIGFSLCDFSKNANFEPAKKYIKTIVNQVLQQGLPSNVVLNVNIPKLDEGQIKGVKVCRQANARWVEKFDKRTNPLGKNYYWLTGTFVNQDEGQDTDEWALNKGYISIVPVQFDLTAYTFMETLNSWDLN